MKPEYASTYEFMTFYTLRSDALVSDTHMHTQVYVRKRVLICNVRN
jgi:hypothetical protein